MPTNNPAVATCPGCNGEKQFFGMSFTGPGWAGYIDCGLCGGTGSVSSRVIDWHKRGQAMKKRRIDAGIGLRERSEQLGIKASDLCKMENGSIEPREDLYGIQ